MRIVLLDELRVWLDGRKAMRQLFGQVALFCLVLHLAPESVKRVIDGDTFALHHVGIPSEERVRLLGVDTPEKGEAKFSEATAFTKSWLAQGDWVLTTCKRDSFGRLLGTAMRDGEDLGKALTAAGLVKGGSR